MARNSCPYIRCYRWGPAASSHLRASPLSRCSATATILREGSCDADADHSDATSTPRHSPAKLPGPYLPNGYATQCVGQDRRAGRLSCLRAEEHDKGRECDREHQSVSLPVPSAHLRFHFFDKGYTIQVGGHF